MQYKNVLAPLMMGAVLIGCGAKPEDSGATKRRLSRNPIKLTKQVKFCDDSYGTFDVDSEIKFLINQFSSGTSFNRDIDFKSMLSGNYVESRFNIPVTDTYYGEESSYKVHGVYDDLTDRYLVKRGTREVSKEIQSSSFLEVCPSTVNYNRNTFEDSGLNINYAITKTYNAVIQADPSITLKGIKVDVAPIKKVDIILDGGPEGGTNTLRYETDNASYSPKDLKITFLPQSKEYQAGTGSKIPFWEVPMVASHEYGHHVFRTLYSDSTDSSLSVVDGCFHSGKIIGITELSSQSGTRDNKIGFAMRSINEGYADLISFYSLDITERGLKEVPCFEKNREVDYPNFSGGTKKIFNLTALELINSSESLVTRRTCNDPDFQEIHDVGAVFAHQVDRVLSEYTYDKSLKLKIVLKWLQKLAENNSEIKYSKAGKIFFYGIELAHKVAFETIGSESGSMQEPTCSKMQTSFGSGHGYSCEILK